MYAVRLFIIIPVLKSCTIEDGYLSPYLNNFWFFLLVMSVVLINAGGYIINDCCDVETDKINKPKQVYVGHSISLQQATVLYYTITILGIIIGCVVSFKISNIKMATIHLASVGLLWLYATQLKKLPVIGNIAVAILSAVVLLLPVFYEPIIFYNPSPDFDIALHLIVVAAFTFACFAFATQLIREMIKDLEDLNGDKATGCNTLPIWTSIKTSKKIIALLILLTTVGIGWFQYYFYVHRSFYNLFQTWNLYTTILLQLPLLFVLLRLSKAETPQQLKVLSTTMKVIMLAGIVSMVFIQQWFQNYF